MTFYRDYHKAAKNARWELNYRKFGSVETLLDIIF